MENMHAKMSEEDREEDAILRSRDQDESDEETTPRKKGAKMNTKYVIIIVGVGLLIALGYHFRSVFIAATVNGSPISRLSVIHELERAAGKQTLTSLITQKVIADEVKKKGIVVSDEEITAEIKRISDMIAAQGGTIEMALAAQGMTMEDFKGRAATQIQVEKLLGDKIAVADEEVDAYIKENKITLPKDGADQAKADIKEQLKRGKVGQEGQALVDTLLKDAKINYFVQY